VSKLARATTVGIVTGPRLEQFDQIPRGIVEQDLRAARPGHDVTAKTPSGGAEAVDLGREPPLIASCSLDELCPLWALAAHR